MNDKTCVHGVSDEDECADCDSEIAVDTDDTEDYHCQMCQDTGEGYAPDSRCTYCPKKGSSRDEP